MHVVELKADDEGEIADFLCDLGKRDPSVLGYHFPFYSQMLSRIGVGTPLTLGVRNSSGLTGLLPGIIRHRDAGTVYGSLPFFGPNGGCLCVDESVRKRLLSGLIEILSQERRMLSASIVTPLFAPDLEIYEKELVPQFRACKTNLITYISNRRWSKALRYDIRRAAKLGVIVTRKVTEARINQLFEIYQDNCRQGDIPIKPLQAIKDLVRLGLPDGRVQLYFAERAGSMIAGLIVIWGPRTASYYLPCMLREARYLQPSSLLIDAAFNDAEKAGLEVWNWESSPPSNPGVEAFKRRWNSNPRTYYIFVRTFQHDTVFQNLGRQGIELNFPFFYVYPFEHLR